MTLTTAGLFLFMVRISLQASSTDHEAAFFLEEDPDTGIWATILGSTAYVGIPGSMRQTVQMVTLVRAGLNYRYRVSMLRTTGAGTISTVGNPVMTVVRLFQNGSTTP
jgi:hypothetical protein